MRTKNFMPILTLFLIVLNLDSKVDIQVDEVLLKGTIEIAESLVFPSDNLKITYNKSTKEVNIKFKTPSSYKVNFSDFYLRWRDNQWVALQEFKKAKIPVKTVTVETNHYDMSGFMKFTHLANHVDKSAKSPSDDLWLQTGEIYQRSKATDKWEKVKY